MVLSDNLAPLRARRVFCAYIYLSASSFVEGVANVMFSGFLLFASFLLLRLLSVAATLKISIEISAAGCLRMVDSTINPIIKISNI